MNAISSEPTKSTAMARGIAAIIWAGDNPTVRCQTGPKPRGEYHAAPTAMRMTAATNTAHQLIGICCICFPPRGGSDAMSCPPRPFLAPGECTGNLGRTGGNDA